MILHVKPKKVIIWLVCICNSRIQLTAVTVTVTFIVSIHLPGVVLLYFYRFARHPRIQNLEKISST